MEREILSTKQKSLIINLDPTIYGTIAEIGGGQEVARVFFQAGGASGTIAKTISAYDKNFSDYFYGSKETERYVSESRLKKMLSHEYEELLSILSSKRRENQRFFVFANTVEIINYRKDNQGNGWLGVQFELTKEGQPNEVVIHVRLKENDALLQQQTLGTLGVNLVWACFNHTSTPNTFLQSLLDNLDTDRIEITMARMSGPDLEWLDNRLLGVQLVKNGMTPAVMFDHNGNVQQPADMLYRKNVLAFRGSFRPITYVGVDMLKASYCIFKQDEDYSRDSTISLCEITLNNLISEGEFHERDFLDRVDLLNHMGQHVMISNFREYYKLVDYFGRFRLKKLRIAIGLPTFEKVLDPTYYSDLRGGILEAFGMLFPKNMKFYIYPMLDPQSGGLLHSDKLSLSSEIRCLYDYLKNTRKFIDITTAKKEWLSISSNEVLRLMREGDPLWETMVPKHVIQIVKERCLFDVKCERKNLSISNEKM